MNINNISNRLKWLASFVTKKSLADIGTDHAFLPIFLLNAGVIKKAIALDVNKGPLSRAKGNVVEAGFKDLVDLRLSNGFEHLKPSEVESVIIAGMGGDLICKILNNGLAVAKTMEEIIISPHSEWDKVRLFLLENDFKINKEDMILDEGKYYLMIRGKFVENSSFSQDVENISEIYLQYGKYLIEEKNQVLKDYLLEKKAKFTNIKSELLEKSAESVGKIEVSLKQINDTLKLLG